jgi:hypothetical protein
MKLGRACAAGAVLWAVALPLTAGTALADETSAPVAEQPSDPSAAPSETATASPAPESTGPAADQAQARARAADAAQARAQVAVRPEGAPETGGGPQETGVGLAVTGGAAALVAAGGAVLVLRRRRAGAR